jgi:limonene-1,2-epoxide hydrolase
MTSALAVVQRFQQALQSGDKAAARKLLAERFTFRGPFDHFDRPEAYLAALDKLQPVIERIHVKKIFDDGNEVCVIYDMVTKTDIGTSTIAEWFQVEDDRIAAIQAVFDARPWAHLFAR